MCPLLLRHHGSKKREAAGESVDMVRRGKSEYNSFQKLRRVLLIRFPTE